MCVHAYLCMSELCLTIGVVGTNIGVDRVIVCEDTYFTFFYDYMQLDNHMYSAYESYVLTQQWI